MVVNGWFAVAAPTATPSGAVTRLNHEIAQYLNAPDIQQRPYSFGLATEGARKPESCAVHPRDQDRWRALAAELDIRPQ
jgi:tripartite-type tricarboxylate transporter receptor subunit TctC